MAINAIKATYNRKTKGYDVTVADGVDAGDVIACLNSGYMVYDDAAKAVASIEAGTMIGSWKAEKKAAIVAYLKAIAA